HTRFSRDWSSDVALPIFRGVCSVLAQVDIGKVRDLSGKRSLRILVRFDILFVKVFLHERLLELEGLHQHRGSNFTGSGIKDAQQIGRASCREREKSSLGA